MGNRHCITFSGMELASIKRRICASTIDGFIVIGLYTLVCILSILLIILLVILLVAVDKIYKLNPSNIINRGTVATMCILYVFLTLSIPAIHFWYNINSLSSKNQATLGQQWMGIYTVKTDGKKINAGFAFYMTILPLLYSCCCFLFLPSLSLDRFNSMEEKDLLKSITMILYHLPIFCIPFLVACFYKKKQTLYNMLSGTLVIKHKKESPQQV